MTGGGVTRIMTGKQTGNYILLQFSKSRFLLMVVLHNISEK
jgi:hypothetical protein